jgi:glycosyltransferase involved in cell wall biosynthesis
MKLLYVVESTAAGVGRQVMGLANGLLKRGHQIHLIYSDIRSDQVFDRNVSDLSARPGFHAHLVAMQRYPDLRDLLAIRSLRRYLRHNGPFDLVHFHSTKAGFIGRLGLAGFNGKRLYSPQGFVTIDPNRSRLVRAPARILEALLSRLCDGIVVVSQHEYLHALGLGIASAKLCLISNGVALDRVSSVRDRAAIRHEWGVGDSDVCIGFIGRLVPVKSPETMLRSFAAVLSRSRTPTKLVMVGDGPLAQSCRRLAVGLGIDPQVIWLGQQDAKTLMHAFDLLALTSDAEGHPLVVLEALARGLPVVATSVGGIAETVRDGVNGFIAPVRGIAEIADALTKLVDNAALRKRMGRASLEIAPTFSIDRMIDQTVAFYQQILSGRSSAPAELEVAPLTRSVGSSV